jgi:hypothetical protein
MNADAPAGIYKIKAKYFSSHQVSAATGATCAVLWHVTQLGDFAHEHLAVSMVRLNRHKQMQDVFQAEVCEPHEGNISTFFADEDTARAASLVSVNNVLDACRRQTSHTGAQGNVAQMSPGHRTGGPLVEEVD